MYCVFRAIWWWQMLGTSIRCRRCCCCCCSCSSCMCVHTYYFSCWKSSAEEARMKRNDTKDDNDNNDNGDGNGKKARMRFSCARQYGNINRNWRFHFIAHYYWFLLRSLSRSIEIKDDAPPFRLFRFRFLSFSLTRSLSLFRSNSRSLGSVQSTTAWNANATRNTKTIQNELNAQSHPLICLCISFGVCVVHLMAFVLVILCESPSTGRKSDYMGLEKIDL